jgi:hypothetical protein
MEESLTQFAGGPQAPNWRTAGKDFIAAMWRLHPREKIGKWKRENGKTNVN